MQQLSRLSDLSDLSDGELAALYAYPDTHQHSHLRANVVSTLDGSAVGSDGRSGSINDAADHRVFALLRALADVIVVGAGTARSEGYRAATTDLRWRSLRQRLGLAAHPMLAVVSQSEQLPQALTENTSGTDQAGPVTILTAGTEHPVDLRTVVATFERRGLRRLLIEGGPQLLGAAVRAGLVDDLCLTISPMLIGGDGPRILTGGWDRHDFRLRHILIGQPTGSLLTRWVSSDPAS